MSYIFLGLSLLIGFLLLVSRGIYYKNYDKINLKIKKSLDKMLKVVTFAPVIVLAVIFILTFAYFKSKGYVRFSHAWLVVVFWLYSVLFYYIFIEIAKIRKLVILLPVVGMLMSVGIAIYLTPLQNYENVFNNINLLIPNLFGFVMLIMFYYVNFTILTYQANNRV